MEARQKHGNKRQRVGNLALAEEACDDPENWQPKGEHKRLRLVEQRPVVDFISDPLAASKGIVIGTSVSIILWSMLLFSLGVISSPFVFFAAAVVLMLVAKDTEQEGLDKARARLREESGKEHESTVAARAA